MQQHLLPSNYLRLSQVCLYQPGTSYNKPSNSSGYEQTLHKKNLQLTEFNSLLHQQHRNVSRYSGSFICKETRSSVQHSHKCSTILQVNYIQIKQQDQPIYIHHNVSLQEHTLHLHSIQINTRYCPYYLPYLTLPIKI